jgi:uncharacterized protein (TIGR02444 family)
VAEEGIVTQQDEEMDVSPLRTKLPDHPFWEFSLRTYGRSGVGTACLGLQDQVGADVNMLLFCCWVAVAGAVRLGDDSIRQALAASESWRTEVVHPLRALRRRLKEGFDGVADEQSQALRRAIQAVEIDAEHVEQLLLAASIPVKLQVVSREADRAAEAADNLIRYLTALGADMGNTQYEQLVVILAACFPELPEAEIGGVLHAHRAR